MGETIEPHLQGAFCLMLFSTGIFSDEQIIPESKPFCKLGFFSPDDVLMEKQEASNGNFVLLIVILTLYLIFVMLMTCFDYVWQQRHLEF